MQHVCVVLNLETSHASYLCTKLFRQLYEFSFEAHRIVVGEPEIQKFEKSGRKVAEF